jgi:integrase/recombinase XerD
VNTAAIPSITIFVRHSVTCEKRDRGELFRQCRCAKHLRWSSDGKQFRRAAKTRAWAIAEEIKREIEDQYRLAANPASVSPTLERQQARTLGALVDLYLTELHTQDAGAETLAKNKRELGRFVAFMTQHGKYFANEVDKPTLLQYRKTWTKTYPAATTRNLVQQRLVNFLGFCVELGDLRVVPSLSSIKVDREPTQPLTDDEYARLLKTVGEMGLLWHVPTEIRLAVIKLMRWAGPSAQDAIMMRRESLQHDEARNIYRVVYRRKKTNVLVNNVIPPAIAEEIVTASELVDSPTYLFQPQDLKYGVDPMIRRWMRFFKKAFERSGMPGYHSHMLRDTFAVGLLLKNIPLEAVAKALGHTSIKTTEKYYSPWIKARQDNLDEIVMAAWS